MTPPLSKARELATPAAELTQRAVSSSMRQAGALLRALPGPSTLGSALDVFDRGSPPPERSGRRLDGALCDRWLKAELPLEVVVDHPKFAHALVRAHVHKRVAFYGHEVTDARGEPALLVEGARVPWRELKARFAFEDGAIREKATGQNYEYLESGLVAWNYKDWETLRPFRTLPEGERPETHVFELVTRPGFYPDYHAWFRLICPTGEVYSIGLRAHALPMAGYGPIAKTSRAQLCCPDIEEFLSVDNQKAVRIPITEAQFARCKASVEADRRQGIHFNYVNNNCTKYTARKAAEVGADIQVDASPLEILVPEPVQSFIDAHVPKPVRGLIARGLEWAGYFGPNIVENAMLVVAGGTQGLDEALEAAGSSRAIIQKPTDLLGASKLVIAWPGRLKAWQAQALAAPPDGRAPPRAPSSPAPSSSREV